MELLEELGAFGVGIVLAISVGALFWKLDDAIAEAPRQKVAEFMLGLSVAPPYPKLPEIISDAFDRVFGQKHFSWYCFRRSCVYSILAVAVLTVIFVQNNPTLFRAPHRDMLDPMFFVIGAIIFNLLPDYVSLLETRIVVQWMRRKQKFFAIFGYLGLDFILTVSIILLVVGGLGLLISVVAREPFVKIVGTIPIGDVLTLEGDTGAIGIFLYSTFFTSVWVWLTALGWGAIRLMSMAPLLLRAMKYLLPIKERPLRSIGEVAAVLVCLSYWAISAMTWITSTPEAQAALGN